MRMELEELYREFAREFVIEDSQPLSETELQTLAQNVVLCLAIADADGDEDNDEQL